MNSSFGSVPPSFPPDEVRRVSGYGVGFGVAMAMFGGGFKGLRAMGRGTGDDARFVVGLDVDVDTSTPLDATILGVSYAIANAAEKIAVAAPLEPGFGSHEQARRDEQQFREWVNNAYRVRTQLASPEDEKMTRDEYYDRQLSEGHETALEFIEQLNLRDAFTKVGDELTNERRVTRDRILELQPLPDLSKIRTIADLYTPQG